MSSIEDTLRYPMEDDDWVLTVLIGGVLSLVSFLIVPALLVSGYFVRAVRANLDGEPEPPSFGDWGELLVDGVKATVIWFVYLLVPIVVMLVTMGGAVTAMLSGSDAGAALGMGGLMIGMLLTVVLGLLFGYLSAVGIVNFAREERFGAAFDLDVVRDVAFDSDFAVPWLVAFGVFIAASLVNVVPLIGSILAVFANFYALIVASRLLADGFTQAFDTGGRTATADVGGPTA